MQSSMARYIFIVLALGITVFILTTFRASRHLLPANFGPNLLDDAKQNGTDLLRVRNATLGFQEIKVISMSSRSDKRDAWAVASTMSDFVVQIVDGVDGSSVSPQALPYTMDLKPGVVGCWRAHMDVLRDIVNRKVSSALIFEDDADWDVSLKSQLVQFARGSRWILNQTDDEPHHSPYGDGWDMLWIGHCGSRPDPWDNRRFVIPHDPTTEPRDIRTAVALPDYDYWPEDLQPRLVYSQYYGVCTNAYAVTLAGAMKILYNLSMLPNNGPVDIGLGDMCRDKTDDFNCIGPSPALIGLHRPAGNPSRWSDIENNQGEDSYAASSPGLMYPVRMNIARLLKGETIFKTDKGTTIGVEEMSLADIQAPTGHGEVVEISQHDAIL